MCHLPAKDGSTASVFGSEGLWFESRFGDRTADKNTGQAIDVRPPLCGSIVAGGFGGLPLSSVLLASARWIIRCGEYVSDVKISTHEGMTAQWQHMQRQFHLPFLPFFLKKISKHGKTVVA
jgi:hypothetical protein